MQLTFNVTARDFKRGSRKSCCKCPVARAILRVLTARHCSGCAYVRRTYVEINGHKAHLPQKVVDFIGYFDAGVWAGQPFSFTLHVPEHVLRKVPTALERQI
jgi:hypothetical protein